MTQTASRLFAGFMLIALVGVSVAWAAQTVEVTIKDLKFAPASITIKPGDTVTWTNRDNRDHAIVAEDGSFKSGNLSSGKNFSFTFKKAGTFNYGCAYHPRMKGMVIVKD